jgi:hypothetical protein
MSRRRFLARHGVPKAAVGLVLLLADAPAHAIPVFARVYDKPCSACHTVYPQLNPEGERFRAKGLHGLDAAVKPLRVAPGLELPGILPLAISLGAGGDFIKVDVPGARAPVSKRFNLNYLAVLVGAELGPHLAFLGDYAMLITNPRTGEETVNKRAGLAFLQAHAERWGWLGNARLGLFELPLGASPRVHRLSATGYLTYNTNAFSLLGRPPPARDGDPQETLSLGSTQLGLELSGLRSEDGLSVTAGADAGSNNRLDQNDAKDVFFRLGKSFGFHRTGLFLYYSPAIHAVSPRDRALRVGPDATFYWRQLQVMGQILAGRDSDPTGVGRGLWWIGGFAEVNYRLTPRLLSLVRVEHVGMPTFDDRDRGGSTHVRRRIWEVVAGGQWLIEENLKLVVEASWDNNHEAVSDRTTEAWAVTVRLATAFWPLSPPGITRWLPAGGSP